MTFTCGVSDVQAKQSGSGSTQLSALTAQTAGAVGRVDGSHDAGCTQEANAPSGQVPVHSLFESSSGVIGNIDGTLLKRALEIVNSIVPADEIDTPLSLAGLGGTVLEMWESAATSSEYHQDILATLENAVRAATVGGSATEQQLSAFREALTDLAQTRLVPKNAEVVRSEFIRQGFGPLAFLEESDETEHEESS